MQLNTKVILGAAAIIVIVVLVSLAQEMNRQMQVQREIARLDQEVATHRKKVVELENLNTYFQTEAFQERVAREKLNYHAPGEKVVIVPDGEYQAAYEAARDQGDANQSLPYLWWEYFFVDTQGS